jgi:hypothetical protein
MVTKAATIGYLSAKREMERRRRREGLDDRIKITRDENGRFYKHALNDKDRGECFHDMDVDKDV